MVVSLNKTILKEIAQDPAAPILNLNTVRLEVIMNWLSSRQSQEFGRFGIYDMNDRKNVAEWFLHQIMAFYNYQAGIDSKNSKHPV
jgi:hypothetical protein